MRLRFEEYDDRNSSVIPFAAGVDAIAGPIPFPSEQVKPKLMIMW